MLRCNRQAELWIDRSAILFWLLSMHWQHEGKKTQKNMRPKNKKCVSNQVQANTMYDADACSHCGKSPWTAWGLHQNIDFDNEFENIDFDDQWYLIANTTTVQGVAQRFLEKGNTATVLGRCMGAKWGACRCVIKQKWASISCNKFSYIDYLPVHSSWIYCCMAASLAQRLPSSPVNHWYNS